LQRVVIALATCLAGTVPGVAVAQRVDSTSASRRPPVIGWVDVGVLGVGLAGSIALMRTDARIARHLQSDRLQRNDRYQDAASVASKVNEKSLFVAGLVTYGVARLAHAHSTTTDIAWHTTESIFIASATATVVRGVLGRSRPFVTADSDAYDYKPGQGFRELRYRAYPSIHAAASFATAAAITAETAHRSKRVAWFVGPVTYALAATPGLARMYDDKHWASDVVMGAALGTAAGLATVRYHHHRPGNRLDKAMLSTSAGPAGGVGLVWTFTF